MSCGHKKPCEETDVSSSENGVANVANPSALRLSPLIRGYHKMSREQIAWNEEGVANDLKVARMKLTRNLAQQEVSRNLCAPDMPSFRI